MLVVIGLNFVLDDVVVDTHSQYLTSETRITGIVQSLGHAQVYLRSTIDRDMQILMFTYALVFHLVRIVLALTRCEVSPITQVTKLTVIDVLFCHLVLSYFPDNRPAAIGNATYIGLSLAQVFQAL